MFSRIPAYVVNTFKATTHFGFIWGIGGGIACAYYDVNRRNVLRDVRVRGAGGNVFIFRTCPIPKNITGLLGEFTYKWISIAHILVQQVIVQGMKYAFIGATFPISVPLILYAHLQLRNKPELEEIIVATYVDKTSESE